MSTPTTNFAFAKPTVGGDADVWGGATNNNWDALDLFLGYTSQGHLYGLALSNNGSDATNDIDIAVGTALDGTNARLLRLASALTKRLDAAWAVGTNQGGLDTGSIDNVPYHVWLIMRSDTGVVDVLFSASATAPTMPANYDFKRRIGAFWRVSNTIRPFTQDGDTFRFVTPFTDVNGATSQGTSAVTRLLTVPTGIRVQAIVRVAFTSAAGEGARLSALDEADVGSGITSSDIYSTATQLAAPARLVRTNTSGQIRSRQAVGGATEALFIMTDGWIDTRGRLAA